MVRAVVEVLLASVGEPASEEAELEVLEVQVEEI
jgi:hypothetical protein